MEYPQAKEDLEIIMKTANGRRFIYNLLETTGIERVILSPETIINAYWQGRASIGAELLSLLRSLMNGLEFEKEMRKEAKNLLKESESKPQFYDNFI